MLLRGAVCTVLVLGAAVACASGGSQGPAATLDTTDPRQFLENATKQTEAAGAAGYEITLSVSVEPAEIPEACLPHVTSVGTYSAKVDAENNRVAMRVPGVGPEFDLLAEGEQVWAAAELGWDADQVDAEWVRIDDAPDATYVLSNATHQEVGQGLDVGALARGEYTLEDSFSGMFEVGEDVRIDGTAQVDGVDMTKVLFDAGEEGEPVVTVEAYVDGDGLLRRIVVPTDLAEESLPVTPFLEELQGSTRRLVLDIGGFGDSIGVDIPPHDSVDASTLPPPVVVLPAECGVETPITAPEVAGGATTSIPG
jgi:hypothetical protein